MPDQSVFPRRIQVLWACAGIAVACATLAVRGHVPTNDQLNYVTRGLAFGAACATVPPLIEIALGFITRWLCRIDTFICTNRGDAADLFRSELKPFVSNNTPYFCGLVFGVAASAITYLYSPHVQPLELEPKIVGIIAIFLANVLAGAALSTLFGFARALWRAGNRDDCTVRLSRDTFGVLSTGALMLKVWGVALVLWGLYIVPAVEYGVHGKGDILTFEQSPVLLSLAIPALVGILIAFIVCQFPLHRKMVESKQAMVEHLRGLIDQLTPSKAEDISDELIRKLQFLETRFGAAQALPEWPSTMLIALEAFGLSAVSIVLPQVVAPIFRSVVGVLFGIPLPSA